MTVVTVANPDDPQKGFLGVTLGIVADSPVTVDFNLDDVVVARVRADLLAGDRRQTDAG